MIKGECKYCHKIFYLEDKSKGWMANHSRWCDLNPKRNDYIQATKDRIKEMNIAKEKSGDFNQFIKAKKMGIIISHPLKGEKHPNPFKGHSEKTKKEISKIRKKFLSENPDKHPWKNNKKFISAPCELLKKKLLDANIIFVEEHQPLSDRYFSIDIAFPYKKLGIEINGNQHYNKNGSLKKYYQDRHNLIERDGWKLIEIHYLDVFKDNILEQLPL